MSKRLDENIHSITNHLFREHYGKMVSYLSQKYGYHKIEDILDAVQESFEAALTSWKFSGIPKNHFAWLYRVASNKLLNKIKQSNSNRAYVNSLRGTEFDPEDYNDRELEDSLLKHLIFFSKIDFSERNKLIISLYFLCGFDYSEIANALVLKTEAVKKVILRSKESIKQFTDKYDGFQIETIDQDLVYLHRIIYIMFNEGYKSSQKKGAINYDLCFEAIRLGKLVQNHSLNNSEINSLLALMFFSSSRFPARIRNNTWISLENQDRGLWNRELIVQGLYYLKKAKRNQISLDKYYLEALISSMHCTSDSYEEANWVTISFLYRQLEIIEPSSIALKITRIISESNFKNILDLITELEMLGGWIPQEATFAFFSSKAYLYSKLDDWSLAIKNYELALNYAKNQMDINYINERINLIMMKPEASLYRYESRN